MFTANLGQFHKKQIKINNVGKKTFDKLHLKKTLDFCHFYKTYEKVSR